MSRYDILAYDLFMEKEMKIPDELPLTESTYFILLSLAKEPKHGYAIIKDVEALSRGRVTFSTGTLYGAIKRMLADAWIRRVEQTEQPYPNRTRKAYTLTEKGRSLLEAEYARLNEMLEISTPRLAEGNI
jgi:DNA-binding PadR family transcriptional regulator